MIDASTLTEAMTEHFESLYWLSYNILHSTQDAQDAVQQGLLKAWAHREAAAPLYVRAWLARIVINESHTIYRYKKRVTPRENMQPPGVFAPPDPDLSAAIEALPEKLRIPFLLKYLLGYSEREIAQALRVPVSTVKNRLFKARKALQAMLSDAEVIIP